MSVKQLSHKQFIAVIVNFRWSFGVVLYEIFTIGKFHLSTIVKLEIVMVTVGR